jgi:hypothetical protein
MPRGKGDPDTAKLYRVALDALGKGIPSSVDEANTIDALVQAGVIRAELAAPQVAHRPTRAGTEKSKAVRAARKTIRQGLVRVAFAQLSAMEQERPYSSIDRLMEEYERVREQTIQNHPTERELLNGKHFRIGFETLKKDLQKLGIKSKRK